MKFQDLKLLPALLRAVNELGYREPTPIQAQAIPPVLAGRDLIGCAQTGTGKTAAFAVPILQMLQGKVERGHRPIRALVLTPTRELALQIQECFQQYGKYLPVRSTVIFGGVGQGPQVEALEQGVDVLVATPGRLNDLCAQGHVDLGKLEIFVLDEADRMLDMGFIHDVRKVIARLPQKRQTLLFSATMPREIAELAGTILRDPVRVEVTPQSSTVDAIEQRLYRVDKANKRRLLVWLLQQRQEQTVLVFTATKHGADRVVKELGRADIAAMAIHGNKSQSNRVRALESFKSGAIRVLVATDIAARGIDISQLPLVINFDLPNVPETYVHRIGRTGRAGHSGLAISFCCYDELGMLKDIEKLIGKKIPQVEDHPWPMEIFAPTPKAERPPRRRQERPARETAPQPEQTPERSGGKRRRRGAQEKRDGAGDRKNPVQHSEAAPVETRRGTPGKETPAGEKGPGPQKKAPVRKVSSTPSLPGHVVAVADGRDRPGRRRRR